MKTNKTRSLLAGLPPRELLASFGLPPDALDQMMDNDQMASRALVLTRGATTLGVPRPGRSAESGFNPRVPGLGNSRPE